MTLDLTETPRPTLEELLAREVDAAEAARDWTRDEAGLAGGSDRKQVGAQEQI